MKPNTPAFNAALALIGLFALIPLLAMWRGYVFAVLWGWFIVPFFHLPTISIPLAIGVGLIVSMLTNHRTGKEIEKEDVPAWHGFAMAAVIPLLGLSFGWIVSKFL